VNFSKQRQIVPAVSLTDVDGIREPLAPSDGRPTVLNLWATWCPPGRAEMPILAKTQANHPNIDIVLVNQGETYDAVSDYLNLRELQVKPVLLDPGVVVSRAISVSGLRDNAFLRLKRDVYWQNTWVPFLGHPLRMQSIDTIE